MAASPTPPWWSVPYTYVAGKFTPMVYDGKRGAWIVPES